MLIVRVPAWLAEKLTALHVYSHPDNYAAALKELKDRQKALKKEQRCTGNP